MYWTKWLSSFGEKTKIPHRLFKRMNNLLHPRKKELVMPLSVKQVCFLFLNLFWCVGMQLAMHATHQVWRPRDNLWELVFPSYHVGPRNLRSWTWQQAPLHPELYPACMCVYQVRRGYQIPWNYSYNWIAMWVLGTEMEFSAKEVGAFSYWAISPAPNMEFNKGNYL